MDALLSSPLIAAAIALLFGYLSGSIPFGVILTRLAGMQDIRSVGSGNIGATNVLRTGNKALAAATLLGDHASLRAITRETGTLLCLDETHTQVCGPGGLTRMWSLEPDLLSSGKSIAGGVPFGTYGMTDEVASVLEQDERFAGSNHQPVATGGTLFGNALSTAAARATLSEVLTEEAYRHAADLCGRLADGVEAALASAGLDWYVHRLYARSGTVFAPTPPRDAREAEGSEDAALTNLFRVWLANRGVWEAIPGAGPTVPVPATDEDVDRYVGAYRSLVRELARA